MVRVLALIAQATLLALIAYNTITAMWGWPERRPAPAGPRRRRVRVVVPAHNEEAVIGTLVGDLSTQDYPADLVTTWVVADRCDDRTVEIAAAAGASVEERWHGNPGKGSALAWHLERHPLGDEALVVFDADNRVPSPAIGRIVDELDAGHTVVQCYLDATNPDSSPIAEAAALSYWAGNRMVQLARSNLGWSADLGGTGFGVTAAAIDAVGGFSDSLTEDQDLAARLLMAGHRVEWVHDVKVGDEKPQSVGVTMRQRARWMAGKRAARRRHLAPLLSRPTPARVDMAIRLVQPGRSFVALLSLILAVVSAVWPGDWIIPWPAWATVTAIQVLQPLPFLARERVTARRIVRYPLLALLAVLWVPIRLISTRAKGWYHTPHTGKLSASETEVDEDL